MTRLLDFLYAMVNSICIFVFGITVIFGITQVVSRYVFGISLSFTEEISRFLFVWVVMLGSALVMRDKSHAAITIFVDCLPKFIKKIVAIFVYFVSLSFLGLLVYHGWKLTLITHMQPAAATGIPMSCAYFAIPAGAFFMLVFLFEILYKEFLVSRGGK